MKSVIFIFLMSVPFVANAKVLGEFQMENSPHLNLNGQPACTKALFFFGSRQDLEIEARVFHMSKTKLLASIADKVLTAVTSELKREDVQLRYIKEQLDFHQEFLTPPPTSAEEAERRVVERIPDEIAHLMDRPIGYSAYEFKIYTPIDRNPNRLKYHGTILAVLDHASQKLQVELVEPSFPFQ